MSLIATGLKPAPILIVFDAKGAAACSGCG
jgi:hypothetical protein